VWSRIVVGPAVLVAVVVSSSPSVAHKSEGVKAQQRVFAKHQNLDRSDARVQLRVANRRFRPIRRLVCETEITDKWFHPVTGEVRTYSEDWFLTVRNFPERSRLLSRKDTIFVAHSDLTTDPQWQPQGVTVRTRHCHAR
jgi:hypothetical protein